jgi:hypothetical protein
VDSILVALGDYHGVVVRRAEEDVNAHCLGKMGAQELSAGVLHSSSAVVSVA